jgi:hypothetical protein
MNYILKSALCALLLLSGKAYANESCKKHCQSSNETCCFSGTRTGLHYRSQGDNIARQLVGWQSELHRPEMCEFYGASYIAFEYTRSFDSCHIARPLFGSDTLRFAGSLVPNRSANELVADNFGLSRTFQGSIKLKPSIENFIVDFGFYLGLDEWAPGFFVQLFAPVVHTRWDLGVRCKDKRRGARNCVGTPFEKCYVTTDEEDTAQLNSAGSIEQALSGNFLFGDMQTPWQSGKFDFGRRTRNGIADIHVLVGQDIISNDCSHLGVFAQFELPTGRKQRSEFVFDPVVGNGGHFGLGGGITAHSILWAGEDYNFSVYLEGNITHLFKSRQCRLFDFKRNGDYSRYLLLKEFDTDGTNLTYNGTLVSATEYNTRLADVSIGVKGEAALKLAYRKGGLGIDIGYDVYGNTHEKVRLRCDNSDCTIDTRKFGIKGTESVCCDQIPLALVNDTPVVFLPGTPFPEGAVAPEGCPALGEISSQSQQLDNNTQSNTTAFTVTPSRKFQPAVTACNVCLTFTDRAQFDAAVAANEEFSANGVPVTDIPTLAGGATLVDPSQRPTVLQESQASLNTRSAESPSYLTHKVFAHVNYMWPDECGWDPHVGIGGEVEFVGRRAVCQRIGVQQWGVWVKGGISF